MKIQPAHHTTGVESASHRASCARPATSPLDAEGVVADVREQDHGDRERERDEEAVAHVARHVPGHVGRGHVVPHPRVLGRRPAARAPARPACAAARTACGRPSCNR